MNMDLQGRNDGQAGHPLENIDDDLLLGLARANLPSASLIEAITHAGIQTRIRVDIDFIDAEDLERSGTGALERVNAILVPGGPGGKMN